MLSSLPHPESVNSALIAQQRRDQDQRSRAGSSGFAGSRNSTSSFGGSSFSSQPAKSTVAVRPVPHPAIGPALVRSGPVGPPSSSPLTLDVQASIQRGGFGSSGHSSGGSSGS